MKIHEYLTEDRILLDVKSNTKEEVIREVSVLLKDAKEIVDFDKFIADVLAREKLNTTGVGDEMAIPHARTDTVEDFVVALGRSCHGIDFSSVDGKPVKLIFLIGTPVKKKMSAYLKFLAHLSRLLKKEDFRHRLLIASSPKEILTEFEKIEV